MKVNAKKRKSSSVSNQRQQSASTGKAKRLSNIEVAEFMMQNNIRDETQLMTIAKRHAEGEKDLYMFILNKSPKCLSELIDRTWKIHDTPAELASQEVPRMTVLTEKAKEGCVAGCSGQWLTSVRQVLCQKKINVYVFSAAVRQLLQKGRQKKMNIFLVGPTNCGKSFLLNSLELIYKTFVNPATLRYAWIGLDECEVAYLNDSDGQLN